MQGLSGTLPGLAFARSEMGRGVSALIYLRKGSFKPGGREASEEAAAIQVREGGSWGWRWVGADTRGRV